MMSKYFKYFGLIMAFIAIIAAGSTALAQTTTLASTFTYQGSISVSGTPFTGQCDFEFTLFPSSSGGVAIGIPSAQTLPAAGGVFTAQLDFGGSAFDGTDRYLEIRAACPTGGTLVLLTPRQAVTPAPYALGLYGLEVQQNATSPNMIGGFSGNTVGAGVHGATIGGGGTLTVGSPNTVNGHYATIGGGSTNTAGGAASTIAGGEENLAGSDWSMVGGGRQNSAIGQYSVVSGGQQNLAGVGEWATVPGGRNNTASGNYSFAAGRRAKAVNDGSFVWGDSTDADISSTAANQFFVRATGGVAFYTDAALTTGCTIPAAGSGWNCTSDRNAKEDFAAVDSQAILNSVLNMPITTWVYNGTHTRHIGPMAQDFYAAFGLGDDDRHINTIDADGVALAAIQGLYQMVQDKDAQIADLQTENETLKTQLDSLDQRIAALEALAAPQQAGLGSPLMLVVLAATGLGLLSWRAARKGSSL